MTEPDVAITDYLLALESLELAGWLAGVPHAGADLRRWCIAFFVGTAVAAALGGTVHGFFVARRTRTGTWLWRGALVSIGAVAASGWMIAVGLVWPGADTGATLTIVSAAFVAFAAAVASGRDAFWVAIAAYLPPTLFLVAGYVVTYRADPDPAIAIGLGGLLLTLVAAAGQVLRVGIHPVYFNHNALFHLLQGIALFMICWSARYLVRA